MQGDGSDDTSSSQGGAQAPQEGTDASSEANIAQAGLQDSTAESATSAVSDPGEAEGRSKGRRRWGAFRDVDEGGNDSRQSTRASALRHGMSRDLRQLGMHGRRRPHSMHAPLRPGIQTFGMLKRSLTPARVL